MRYTFCMEFLQTEFGVVAIRLLIAMTLGLLLGLERIHAHKTAGMRTYALVAVASAFFILIGEQVLAHYRSVTGIESDPIRLASQIVVGVGFLGAGLIIFKDNHIQNLTSAAGLWMSAAIGVAVGFGLIHEAIFATLLTLFILWILAGLEYVLRSKYFGYEEPLPVAPKRRKKKTDTAV